MKFKLKKFKKNIYIYMTNSRIENIAKKKTKNKTQGNSLTLRS